MGLDLDYMDGQTPLDEDEKDGLGLVAHCAIKTFQLILAYHKR